MSSSSTIVTGKMLSIHMDWKRGLLLAALAGLIYYSYWWQPVEGGTSCYNWLTGHWSTISNYSHGPLIPFMATGLLWWTLAGDGRSPRKEWTVFWMSHAIPFVFGMVLAVLPSRLAGALPGVVLFWQVWMLRHEIAKHAGPATTQGLWVLGVAMLFYYMGVRAVQPRVVVFSFVILLYGLALALAGRAGMRVLFFPITFLLLMIPLNFLDEQIGFPLRMLVAKSSVAILNHLGIAASRQGTGIYSSVFQFDVADPCSGIRSLMALMTVTAAYAYVTLHIQWKRWVLFLSAMPLAVLGNLARVTSIALVAQVYGQELATKVYHDFSGYVIFGVALSLMVILGVLLTLPYRRIWAKWLTPVPLRTGT